MKTLHTLLGLDKANPLLEILVDPETPDELLVHFGMHFLEKVKRNTIEEKLLAARLYNAGFKRKKLKELFGFDRKTMQRWGEALRIGDIDRILKVFSGKGAGRKISPDIEKRLRCKYRQICEQQGCHSNSYLRQYLQEEYEISVTDETLRLILKDEQRKMDEETVAAQSCDLEFPVILYHREQKTAAEIADIFADIVSNSTLFPRPGNCDKKESTWNNHRNSSSNMNNISNPAPDSDGMKCVGYPSVKPIIHNPLLLHHAGLLLVRMFIDQITRTIEDESDIVRQWIGMILCDSVNIEQGRKINYSSLEIILGEQKQSSDRQREELHRIATQDNVQLLLRRNIVFVKADNADTFLYDPHGIEYTGQLLTLKGWLGSKKRVAKAYYQDFIHTTDGTPVFVNLDDNYYDMRQRFMPNLTKFRQILSGDKNRPLTIIVDRAIYDVDLMRSARDEGVFIITWEKNYTKGQWETSGNLPVQQFSIMRCKNSAQDTITYKVQYMRRRWETETSFLQFILLLMKPNKEPIELSVICTAPNRPSIECLEPILRRWLQENDFLFLDRLGINEMTSYSSYSYEEIAEMLDDRTIKNKTHKKLCAERLKLKKTLGFLMLKEEEFIEEKSHFEKQSSKELSRLNMQIETFKKKTGVKEELKKIRKMRDNLKNRVRNYPEREKRFLQKSQKEQTELRQEIMDLTGKIDETPSELSRLEQVLEEGYRKLNFMPKTFMDAIKIISRNIIYRLLQPFRLIYNNRRNDHVLLRELMTATGWIEENDSTIFIKLFPSREYQGAIKKDVLSFLVLISYELNRFYKSEKTILLTLYDM